MKKCCWLSYFRSVNCIYRVLGHVLYAAVMLSKFYKITILEKKIVYTSFQQATRLSFTRFSSRWKYQLGVSMGLSAHRLLAGVGVCQVGIREGS